MKKRTASLALTTLIATGAMLSTGCEAFLGNFFEEIDGSVTIVVVNNTPYRASFTVGAYDAFDLNPPGPITMEQRRLEANTTEAFDIDCRRNIAIGTQDMLDRAVDRDEDDSDGFDADAFATGVNFSAAAVGDPGAALPTIGTAEGREVLLGVNYACGDELIFTFVEDATTAGGFRIEYQLLHTEEES